MLTLYQCAKAAVARYLASDTIGYNVLYCIASGVSPSECADTTLAPKYYVVSLYKKFSACYRYSDQLVRVFDFLSSKEAPEPLVSTDLSKCRCGAFLWHDRIIALDHIHKAHLLEIHEILRKTGVIG